LVRLFDPRGVISGVLISTSSVPPLSFFLPVTPCFPVLLKYFPQPHCSPCFFPSLFLHRTPPRLKSPFSLSPPFPRFVDLVIFSAFFCWTGKAIENVFQPNSLYLPVTCGNPSAFFLLPLHQLVFWGRTKHVETQPTCVKLFSHSPGSRVPLPPPRLSNAQNPPNPPSAPSPSSPAALHSPLPLHYPGGASLLQRLEVGNRRVELSENYLAHFPVFQQ